MFGAKPQPVHDNVFSELGVQMIATGKPGARIAVHTCGVFDGERTPLVCLPGYYRNMLDYLDFVRGFARHVRRDWPIVLLDLQGRGRSSSRRNVEDYTSVADVSDVASVMDALGIAKAVVLGMGHGGQVAMSMGVNHQERLAGVVLLDAGPLVDTVGLVRGRDNCRALQGVSSQSALVHLSREILGRTHRGLREPELDALAARTHQWDRRRPRALFDVKLVDRLKDISVEDEFQPQWTLLFALNGIPLMLGRSQLSEDLPRAIFERMTRLRPDAPQLMIEGEGSPALLNRAEQIEPIGNFVRSCSKLARLDPVVAG